MQLGKVLCRIELMMDAYCTLYIFVLCSMQQSCLDLNWSSAWGPRPALVILTSLTMALQFKFAACQMLAIRVEGTYLLPNGCQLRYREFLKLVKLIFLTI